MSALFENVVPTDAQFEIGISTVSNKGHQVRQAVFKISGTANTEDGHSYLVIKQVDNRRVEELSFSIGQVQSYLHKTFVDHWLCCQQSGKDIEFFNEFDQPVNGNDYEIAFNVSGKQRLMISDCGVSLSCGQEKEVPIRRWYRVENFGYSKIGVLTLWPASSHQLAVFDVDGKPYPLTMSEWASLREFWRDVVSETKIVVELDERGFQRSGSAEHIKTFTPLAIIKNGFKQALSERFNEPQLFMGLRSFIFFDGAKKPWITNSERFAIGFCEQSNQVFKLDRNQTLHLTVLSFNSHSNSWVIGFDDSPVGVLEIPYMSDVVMFRDQAITIKAVLVDGRLVKPICMFDESNESRSLFNEWSEILTGTWPLDREHDLYSVIRN